MKPINYLTATYRFHGKVRSRFHKDDGYEWAKAVIEEGGVIGANWLYLQPKLRDEYYETAHIYKRREYSEEELAERNAAGRRLRLLHRAFQAVKFFSLLAMTRDYTTPVSAASSFMSLSHYHRKFQNAYLKMKAEPMIDVSFDDVTETVTVRIPFSSIESAKNYGEMMRKQSALTDYVDWSLVSAEVDAPPAEVDAKTSSTFNPFQAKREEEAARAEKLAKLEASLKRYMESEDYDPNGDGFEVNLTNDQSPNP